MKSAKATKKKKKKKKKEKSQGENTSKIKVRVWCACIKTLHYCKQETRSSWYARGGDWLHKGLNARNWQSPGTMLEVAYPYIGEA